MVDIATYQRQLADRRTQLQQAQNQVSSTQFQTPIVEQRALRTLTPVSSVRLGLQISNMQKDFEQKKAQAMQDIQKGFTEQTQLESDFAPTLQSYQDYQNRLAKYNQAKQAYSVAARAVAAGRTDPIGLTKSQQAYFREMRQGARAAQLAPPTTVTIETIPAQNLPGVSVQDRPNAPPTYLNPDTGKTYSSFAELQKASYPQTISSAPVTSVQASVPILKTPSVSGFFNSASTLPVFQTKNDFSLAKPSSASILRQDSQNILNKNAQQINLIPSQKAASRKESFKTPAPPKGWKMKWL